MPSAPIDGCRLNLGSPDLPIPYNAPLRAEALIDRRPANLPPQAYLHRQTPINQSFGWSCSSALESMAFAWATAIAAPSAAEEAVSGSLRPPTRMT